MALIAKILMLILLVPAMAGIFTSGKDSLREAVQNQSWPEVISRSQNLLESGSPESQKDLYRLVQAMALFRQAKMEESIKILEPISEKSLYFPWAKVFLSRLAYITEDNELLEKNLQGLSKITLKGEIKTEKIFYEAHLLIHNEKWKEAEKTLKSIERRSRGSDLHTSLLEAMALVQSQASRGPASKKSKSTSTKSGSLASEVAPVTLVQSLPVGHSSPALCRTLKTLYTKYPTHVWFKEGAPEIKDIILGGKKFSCLVTDADFNKRRRALNLEGEFAMVDMEIKKWFELKNTPYKDQKLIQAQQRVAEGHPEDALKELQTLQANKEYSQDVEVLSPLSFAAARVGNIKLAIDSTLEIHQILGSSKKGTMALYQAAVWAYQIRDYDNAENRFQKLNLRRLSRNYQKEVQWYLGWLRYLKGDYIAAEKSFRTMIKNRARGRGAYKNSMDRIHYWLAMSLFQRGQMSKARNIFEKLQKKKGMNYYSFLARERLKQIPSLTELEKKEESVELIVAGRFNYMTPYVEDAPRPSLQELEAAEMEEMEGETEESALLAEESSATENSGAETNSEEDKSAESTVSSEKEGDEAVAKGEAKEKENKSTDLFSQSEANQKLERAKAFWSVGLEELARREVGDLENYLTGFELFKKVTEEYRQMGLYNKVSSLGQDFVGRANLNSNRFVYESIYPQAYADMVEKSAMETNVARSLIWGIMKAESMYRPWVRSPVGALGLMQVMPNTGQRLAELMDYKSFSPQVLLRPSEAIRFGSKYLERLGKKFDHTVQLVAAAYNAGPHRVSQWLYYFGYMQMDEWVEHIPFLETRNYVKKVTVNYMAYNELYGASPGSHLALIGPVPVQIAGAPETKENWE